MDRHLQDVEHRDHWVDPVQLPEMAQLVPLHLRSFLVALLLVAFHRGLDFFLVRLHQLHLQPTRLRIDHARHEDEPGDEGASHQAEAQSKAPPVGTGQPHLVEGGIKEAHVLVEAVSGLAGNQIVYVFGHRSHKRRERVIRVSPRQLRLVGQVYGFNLIGDSKLVVVVVGRLED